MVMLVLVDLIFGIFMSYYGIIILMKTAYVGMSGGVDSSVSTLLLKQQGYRVVGVYMKNWSRDLPGMKCPWAEDLADAKRVAVKLGIDFFVWDFEKEYREKVVEYMLREFRAGNTPNPDIMCNQEIKFKLFYEKAMEAGADYIATGHYARIGRFEHNCLGDGSLAPVVTGLAPSSSVVTSGSPQTVSSQSSRTCLMRAIDENKDQTYFLYRISEEALEHTLFPIGEMRKPEVKELAKKHGLHNAYKKESMGVCFVGEVGMKDFLKEYIDAQPGEIREIESNKVLGFHEGAVFYTIGQRHGLYLDGEKGVVNDGLPYYVVKKDVGQNIVYVSKNLNDENLWVKELKLKDVFMRTKPAFSSARLEFSSTSYAGQPAEPSLRDEPVGDVRNIRVENSNHVMLQKKQVLVRLRHRAPLIPATFDGETLHFEHEVKRPASGQSAVLYDGEICIGGGIIA
ncbi:tRNA-specific 2-thiouridylase [Candidatus Saccharibacteria bacterium]|nr:tRNA-specific 2-thiouridylase [Candidatus Saccharibacteria bacterium]